MDKGLNPNFFNIITPILATITYFSAFKNGKPTCDRYLANYFLYILTSFSLYVGAIRYYDKNDIKLEGPELLIGVVAFILLFIIFLYTDSVSIKHISWVLIVFILAYMGKRFALLDKEVLQDTLVKLMVILLVCFSIAITYPQFITASVGLALFVGLLFVILFRIIDTFYYNKKYDNLISQLAIFVFSGYVIYDTKRVMDYSKQCKGNADYLTNMSDMFINILNLFANLYGLDD
tara:strand:- start:675 stop:1376 length:702 start_codon:yes stop_codon:yes gene_type:complete